MNRSLDELTNALTAELRLAEHIDAVHVSLIELMDMTRDGEIDLILDQPGKSSAQKEAFLQKVLAQHGSPELNMFLMPIVKEQDFDFFSKKNFLDTVKRFQRAVEAIKIVKLRVAVKFKPADIKDMVNQFSEQMGHPVAFDLTVEPSLIGGAIIQYGSYINDYSLASRLKQFREHWRKAAVIR